MKFDTPATTNPIDQLKVVGHAIDRIDGPKKTTGTAPYAYERHDVVPNQAYGYVIGSAIAKGRVDAMHVDEAKAATGVIAVVTTLNVPQCPLSKMNTASLFGGADIHHYHQAIAVVVAETFEQARAAAMTIRTDYTQRPGKYDLEDAADGAPLVGGSSGEGSSAPPVDRVGNFDAAHAPARSAQGGAERGDPPARRRERCSAAVTGTARAGPTCRSPTAADHAIAPAARRFPGGRAVAAADETGRGRRRRRAGHAA